ncbi:hypothetical protein OT109_11965 [Phycisphaeraceae bacterium D3-23]
MFKHSRLGLRHAVFFVACGPVDDVDRVHPAQRRHRTHMPLAPLVKPDRANRVDVAAEPSKQRVAIFRQAGDLEDTRIKSDGAVLDQLLEVRDGTVGQLRGRHGSHRAKQRRLVTLGEFGQGLAGSDEHGHRQGAALGHRVVEIAAQIDGDGRQGGRLDRQQQLGDRAGDMVGAHRPGEEHLKQLARLRFGVVASQPR